MIPFSVKSTGLYEVIVGYHSAMDKGFVFQMNNNPPSSGTFKSTGGKWGRVSAGKFLLSAGRNKAFVRDGWGYYEVVSSTCRISSIKHVPRSSNKCACAFCNTGLHRCHPRDCRTPEPATPHSSGYTGDAHYTQNVFLAGRYVWQASSRRHAGASQHARRRGVCL